MKIIYFFRCLPFLMFVSGTSQGSEGKKFDAEVERYLEQHPNSRPLFEKAAPEKIERWMQWNRRYEGEFQKRSDDLHAGWVEFRKLTTQETQLHEQITRYSSDLEKLKNARLNLSQDKIKKEPSEPYFTSGRAATWNPNLSAYEDNGHWGSTLNVDFLAISPSPQELDLQKKIDECYKRIDELREEQQKQELILNQKNNELELDLEKFYSEVGVQHTPHLLPLKH